ncbi:G-type lectin S-receptor-like serine/threonine-protein kinase-like protein [Drosera capensis]
MIRGNKQTARPSPVFTNRRQEEKARRSSLKNVPSPRSGNLGYVKAVASVSRTSNGSGSGNSNKELSGQGKFVAPTSSSGELETFSIPGLPVRYTYEDLKAATDDFSNQIGSGGFSTVYKGVLSDNTVVAVKKKKNSSSQGKREFCTEIAGIGNVRHANLVKLKGFCAQGRERLLVYEYMNRGSLGRCEHKIIHYDVKPENILLHDQIRAKLSDFGLSKLLNPEQSGHVTTMRGTMAVLHLNG